MTAIWTLTKLKRSTCCWSHLPRSCLSCHVYWGRVWSWLMRGDSFTLICAISGTKNSLLYYFNLIAGHHLAGWWKLLTIVVHISEVTGLNPLTVWTFPSNCALNKRNVPFLIDALAQYREQGFRKPGLTLVESVRAQRPEQLSSGALGEPSRGAGLQSFQRNQAKRVTERDKGKVWCHIFNLYKPVFQVYKRSYFYILKQYFYIHLKKSMNRDSCQMDHTGCSPKPFCPMPCCDIVKGKSTTGDKDDTSKDEQS